MSVSTDDLLAGNVLALAQAITRIERRDSEAESLLAELYPRTGNSQLVGITGPPGSGKSTLLCALATHLRATELKVAILAVDPTSHVTGGALLGDRIRMTGLEEAANVYIRSLATRGAQGSLSDVVWDSVTVLDALGYDPIFIETVGTGQNEFEIGTLAHTTVLVDAPGLGDSIQALKAGLLETSDIVVVNKEDRPGSHLAAQQLKQALRLGPPPVEGTWLVPVLTTEALSGSGVPLLWEQMRTHYKYIAENGQRQEQDAYRAACRVDKLVQEGWERTLARFIKPERRAQVLEMVYRKEMDPHRAAQELSSLLPKPPSATN